MTVIVLAGHLFTESPSAFMLRGLCQSFVYQGIDCSLLCYSHLNQSYMAVYTGVKQMSM